MITGSLAAHALVVLGLYAASVWGIERLEGGPGRVIGIALAEPPPPAGGSPPVVRAEASEPKRPVVTTLVQPAKRDVRSLVAKVTIEPGTGVGTGTGTGAGDGPCAIGPCDTIASTPIAPPTVPAVTDIALLAPDDVAALRISGETQIEPSPERRMQLGKLNIKTRFARLSGIIELCAAADGTVTSTEVLQSTGYSDYDRALEAAVQRWRYRPYTVAGVARPFCGSVQFNYSLDISHIRVIDGATWRE